MKTITIQDNIANRLHFLNMLNKAGVNNNPVIYTTLFEARISLSSMLTKIEGKLSDKEIKLLVDRIESIR